MSDSDVIDKDFSRTARVRIDMAAMLLYRLANRQMLEPCMFLWTDSSPQWRGKEFCASSFDVIANGVVQRRLLPCVALAKGRTGAVQKALALLWQISLVVGADQVQAFCRSVRGVITDMGIERLIVRMPIQLLQAFMRHIGSNAFICLDSPIHLPACADDPWVAAWHRLVHSKGVVASALVA